jgi:hypothetical protein
MKKIENGSDKNKINNHPPQPSFYLYYIRLRDMKMIKNGSDNNKINKDPPQPYFYL